MGYKVSYRKAAIKFLDAQNNDTRRRIMDAVDKLPDGDVKSLTGRNAYRLRVGQFRVIYEFDGINNEFDIVTIASRGDVYKK